MDASSSPPIEYRFRARIVGAEQIFRLAPGALEWESGSERRRIAYRDIGLVRLSYRPANMSLKRYLAEIWPREGSKLSIASVSAQGPFNLENRGAVYSPFVVELGKRVDASQPGFRFEAGMPRWRWWPAAAFAGATLVALIYVAVQALLMGDSGLALVMLIFGAFFVLQAGMMLLRNRPRMCEARAVPADILP